MKKPSSTNKSLVVRGLSWISMDNPWSLIFTNPKRIKNSSRYLLPFLGLFMGEMWVANKNLKVPAIYWSYCGLIKSWFYGDLQNVV